jgi:hypothetical protein
MRMRNQWIVVIAVAFATLAVAGNVFAFTRAAVSQAESRRTAETAPWARPGVETTATTEAPHKTANDEAVMADSADDLRDDCSNEDQCADDAKRSDAFSNHGRLVSAGFLRASGYDEIAGPLGHAIREIARPDIESDGPPRSDRAEQNGDKDKNIPPAKGKNR